MRPASFVVAAILLASARMLAQQGPATPAAQAPAAQAPAPAALDVATSNFFDFGFRATGYSEGSDEARHQRYRDLRNGLTLDAFRFANETTSRLFTAEANHTGYRDQRYAASLNQFGRVKATFEWNQIPLFFSQDTLALHTAASPGVLRIDDSIQSGIQNGTTTLPASVGAAIPFEMRLKRDIADLQFVFNATPNLDASFLLRNTNKNGSQPWDGTYGFSNAVELAVPVDTRTTELGTALEWGNQRGTVRVAYDGSFFRNNIDTVVWDNPLRITDSPSSGPLQGRMSLWPDSTMNSGSGMGTLNLKGRSRATAYVSIGNWSQNALLNPFTINSAIPVFPLNRATAEADALVTAMHYTFTSRPADAFSYLVRFRSYDFDNRTPEFAVADTVRYDTSVSALHAGTSPLDVTRTNFDAEATYSPARFTALRAGYSVEDIDQTFRHTDTTTEHTLRLSADLTGTNWLTLRGVYEHAKRTGSGFDDQVLDDIGEQTTLRQFDISDRVADRVSAIVMAIPRPELSFTGSVSIGRDDRPETGFGVLSGDGNTYSLGVDYAPRDAVAFWTTYTYERYATLQKSRQADPGPQFEDPTRDWTTDATERADTVDIGADLIKAWARTDVKLAYTYSKGQSMYVYGLAPNTTLPPVQQLPEVVNQLQKATVDVRYYLRRNLSVGGMYWFDKYGVDDYANEPETLNSIAQPSFLMIGYTTRPYTAHTVIGRLTYLW